MPACRGLLMMVSKRSSLLKYLRLHDRKKYLEVISRLGIPQVTAGRCAALARSPLLRDTFR